MPTITLAMQMLPLGEPDNTLITKAIEIIRSSGIAYEVGPLETVLEGNTLDELLAVVKKIHDTCATGDKKIFLNMKLLACSTGIASITDKVTPYR